MGRHEVIESGHGSFEERHFLIIQHLADYCFIDPIVLRHPERIRQLAEESKDL